jgi:4-hydroxyphenylacetate 3-monooxygenase
VSELTAPPTLELRDVRHGVDLVFVPERVVIAAFTAADRTALEAHLRELEEEGVTVPETYPVYYELPVELLTTAPAIDVTSAESSGEVEPVLLCTPGGWFVGVGSDHTARDLERVDIATSKRACPKVIATDVVPYDEVTAAWDTSVLRSWTGAGDPYQEGKTGSITPIPELVEGLRATGVEPEGTVMFCGTVPLLGGRFDFSDRFRIELAVSGGPTIGCTYEICRPGGIP